APRMDTALLTVTLSAYVPAATFTVPPAVTRLTASWMRPVVPDWAPASTTNRVWKSPWKPTVPAVSVPAPSQGVKSTFPFTSPAPPAGAVVPHQLADASTSPADWLFNPNPAFPLRLLLNTGPTGPAPASITRPSPAPPAIEFCSTALVTVPAPVS